MLSHPFTVFHSTTAKRSNRYITLNINVHCFKSPTADQQFCLHTAIFTYLVLGSLYCQGRCLTTNTIAHTHTHSHSKHTHMEYISFQKIISEKAGKWSIIFYAIYIYIYLKYCQTWKTTQKKCQALPCESFFVFIYIYTFQWTCQFALWILIAAFLDFSFRWKNTGFVLLHNIKCCDKKPAQLSHILRTNF